VHAGTLSIGSDQGGGYCVRRFWDRRVVLHGNGARTQIPSPGPNDKVRLASAAASVDLTPTSTLKYEAGTVGN